MSDPVKRVYSSPLRAAQARETRRLLVAAAAELFLARGFGPATIDAVAEAAGVSRKTVFTAVGGKTELLKLALDWAIAGDDEPVPMAERPEVTSVFTEPAAHEVVRRWLRLQAAIDARIAGLWEALHVAAGLEAEARAVLDELQDQRLQGARAIAGRLAELGALRPGLSRTSAGDLLWLASDPVLWSRLVSGRGWSARRFTDWLIATTSASLLGKEPGTSRPIREGENGTGPRTEG